MHIIISPSKALNFDKKAPVSQRSELIFSAEARQIMEVLKEYNPEKLQKLMSVSASLAALNYDRNQTWHHPFMENDSKRALYAFQGDVYEGMEASTMSRSDIDYAQEHLSILSGLYGLLRPLDNIMPYRLEMGTSLSVGGHSNLYKFWGSKITEALESRMSNSGDAVLINLASTEYFKSVNTKQISTTIITPDFKDEKNGKFQIISFYAKRARGLMTRYIIENRLTDSGQLISFNEESYFFEPELSTEKRPVFIRLQKK